MIKKLKAIFSRLFKKKSHIKLGFYGPPNAGKCVTPDTQIVLQNGEVVSIKEVFDRVKEQKSQFDYPDNLNEAYIDCRDLNIIVPSFNPQSLKITPKKVSFVYTQKYSGDIYHIKTASGRYIKATPNHPLIRISDKGIEKTRSSKLKIGQSIAIARKLALSTKITLPEISQEIFNVNGNLLQAKQTSNFKVPTSITIPTYIEEDFVSFIAYVLAESYHTKNRIIFSNLDQNLLGHFARIAIKLFNLNLIKRINKGVPQIEINSKTLTDYLSDVLKFKPANSGNKEIPFILMGLPDNLISTFLRALFDSEGSLPNNYSKRGACIEFTSKSKKMVEQVQILLYRFGIVGKIQERIIKGQSYSRLLISGSDNHRIFKERIGFSIAHKQERLENLCKAGLKRNVFALPIVNLLENIRKSLRLTQNEFFLDDKHITRMKKTGITYHRLSKMASLNKSEFVSKLSNSDALWDKIISVEKEAYDGYVYDLTVEDTHTFLTSSGLIAHNTTLCNKICMDWLGEEMGVVSKIPHETREIKIKEKVTMKANGKELTFNVIDTPGIATKIDYEDFMKFNLSNSEARKRAREATKGVIEAIKWLDNVDCVVVVLDSTRNPYSQVNITIIGNLAARNIPVLIVANKIDLKTANIKKIEAAFPQYPIVSISAEKGKNIENFYKEVFKLVK